MPDKFTNDNSKTIWQNQPMEAPRMTLETIRQKASESQSKTRRELIGGIAITLIVVGISVLGMLWQSNAGTCVMFAIAIAWALAGQSFLHRGMWGAGLPADATLSTGLEFYHQQIKNRQAIVRRVLEWSFGPVILSIGTFVVVLVGIARGRSLPVTTVLPFSTLCVVWIVAFFLRRSREQRKLLREIDQLRNAETANQK
jgi:hypothetical protein